MLIAVVLSAWIVAPRAPFTLTPAAAFQQATVQSQSPDEPAAKDGKKAKADQGQDADQKKEKKPKQKKVAKEDKPSPDEPDDDEADPNMGGARLSWVRHPSLRIGTSSAWISKRSCRRMVTRPTARSPDSVPGSSIATASASKVI
jgi:hypothetical protein